MRQQPQFEDEASASGMDGIHELSALLNSKLQMTLLIIYQLFRLQQLFLDALLSVLAGGDYGN